MRRRVKLTYNWYEMPVTQWAAVRTYWSPISAPPHAYCILLLRPLVYPKRASQGYLPIGASSPPTILGQTENVCSHDEAKRWIGSIDSLNLGPVKSKMSISFVIIMRICSMILSFLDFTTCKAITYYKSLPVCRLPFLVLSSFKLLLLLLHPSTCL